MNDALPTPPASPSSSSSSSSNSSKPPPRRADLAQELDVLLERYLHLLDEQQSLQDGLGKQMAAGFISLARANQSCPPGRWFGRDYYDERMKAVRKIEISAPEKATADEEKDRNDEDTGGNKEDKKKPESEPVWAPSFKMILSPKPGETATTGESDDSKPTESTPDTEEKPSGKGASSSPDSAAKIPPSASRDPLRWFGVLVPPSLRAAQGSFACAIEGPVPQLARVVGEMREVEGKVDKLRGLLEAARTEL